jgi:AcrR family transcriptional regulator
MARWEPDARGRLQQAAMELFRERGYNDVTVAEIADRAGLTKRTFFNHFADKREVFFDNGPAFEQNVLRYLAEADPALAAVDAAMDALVRAGLDLAPYYEFGKARLEILEATPELRERDLIKAAGLTTVLAEALGRRGVTGRTARFAAQAALSVFTIAAAEWIAHPDAEFPELMRRTLAELREAVSG